MTRSSHPIPLSPSYGEWTKRPARADAVKLTAYFGERSRVGHKLVADELLDACASHEIRASILLRGTQGFGAKHRVRTDRLLTLSEDLPVVAMAVDDRHERMRWLVDHVRGLIGAGMVTVERTQLATGQPNHALAPGSPTDGISVGTPAETASTAAATSWMKLSTYIGRHERVDGVPAFVAACRALHELGVSGATVLLGVDGTRHGHRQRARFFARNAQVPAMILAVGDGGQMIEGLQALQTVLPHALFSLERVRLCKRDGQLLDRPQAESSDGLQKLTVVTSEAARHDKRPVHLELVRRLRTAQAAGATSVRGIWGFHGDHRPHGDRLLSVRRHVPIVTVVIDAPERIARVFPIVDELTAERGLVTSETMPANIALSTRL